VTNNVGIKSDVKSSPEYYLPFIPDPDSSYYSEDQGTFDSHYKGGEMIIYPNPARDFIYVIMPDASAGPGRLKIYDLSGRILLDKQINEFNNYIKFPLRFLPGTYITRIFQGNVPVFTKKLLIIQ